MEILFSKFVFKARPDWLILINARLEVTLDEK